MVFASLFQEPYMEDATLKELGKLSKDLSSRFCCGGKLQPAQSRVHLNYEIDGEIEKIVLPGADAAALTKLVSASSVASFGKGNQQVIDLSYRNSHEIVPDKLTTLFCPYNTNILREIETVMVPYRSIRAELYKLNLYTGPGGCFKSHVDTPHSGDMFGSLVVCLPTQFSGGALVARHDNQEVVFDWSSLPDDPLSVIYWAAFFSDVEHEILPVTSGHRLTLNYNLYAVQEGLHSVPPGMAFHNHLQRALCAPHFMRGGGCLAFDCKHLYAFGMLNEKEQFPHVLKGADYLIFSAAKMLGLRVTVKAAVEGDYCMSFLPHGREYTEDDERFNAEFLGLPVYRSVEWKVILNSMGIDNDEIIFLPHDSIKICRDRMETQVNQQFLGTYGNAIVQNVYQSAVILIEVPPWGDTLRTIASESDSREPEKKKQLYQHLFDADSKNVYCWNKIY